MAGKRHHRLDRQKKEPRHQRAAPRELKARRLMSGQLLEPQEQAQVRLFDSPSSALAHKGRIDVGLRRGTVAPQLRPRRLW